MCDMIFRFFWQQELAQMSTMRRYNYVPFTGFGLLSPTLITSFNLDANNVGPHIEAAYDISFR
jgi:hypothetical protein